MALAAIIFWVLFSNLDSSEFFPIAMLLFGSLTLVIVFARFIYLHALAYERNAVAWATAFVFFSPLWAGIAHLLTWPKDASERRQRLIEEEQVVEQHCPKCGIKMKRKDKFCAECGVNLIEYEVTDWQCEECGAEVAKDNKFCSTCGVEFATDKEETDAQDSK